MVLCEALNRNLLQSVAESTSGQISFILYKRHCSALHVAASKHICPWMQTERPVECWLDHNLYRKTRLFSLSICCPLKCSAATHALLSSYWLDITMSSCEREISSYSSLALFFLLLLLLDGWNLILWSAISLGASLVWRHYEPWGCCAFDLKMVAA